ncbi:MAG: NAD-dependent epimerase/dehydratase family protein [Anaerolineales bacterium]|nr:NAD-dependent epimerase/dehydratase family protein [Anaerolineales bacterium]MCS7246632.1 NAD-dependent epimerase/dehydratase family protein [Anaerolineales bacterium]MDW8160442.1 NAD-dependent epimerase/dehydratase family protein [Anaerolineales bacterium]MDW8447314.1 NAD-dependent epimerase/dehydratase family protein [Anaerolineales bacterium]
MRKKVILVTGGAGEIGTALIDELWKQGVRNILSLDIRPLPLLDFKVTHVLGDICDRPLLERLVAEYEFDTIFHLAALLSTRAEFTPEAAHRVNVEGTLGLLQLASDQSDWRGKPVLFIFPSSVAVYGLPDLATKAQFPRVREWEWNYPRTMYGSNKLYCEMLGVYYSKYYRQLAVERPVMVDFRAVRFPGLISAFTLPSGGTSDYGPEMIHAAAQGHPYACFVREDTRIPFMAMPDAIRALLQLAATPAEKLSRRVYNVTSFSLSAGEFREWVLRAFPNAQVIFEPDLRRQAIVDSWPEDMNDNDARRDWGWQPEYNLERTFTEYLFPNIVQRYRST